MCQKDTILRQIVGYLKNPYPQKSFISEKVCNFAPTCENDEITVTDTPDDLRTPHASSRCLGRLHPIFY